MRRASSGSSGLASGEKPLNSWGIEIKSFFEAHMEVFPFGDTFLQFRKIHNNRNSPFIYVLTVKSYIDVAKITIAA